MNLFDILHILQLLTMISFEAGFVYLHPTLYADVIKECRSIINRKKDNQHLAINYSPNKVYEGQSVTLCCCSKRLTKSIAIWWGTNKLPLSLKHDTKFHCHKIMNVSRNDSGVFRCYVNNENGIFNADVKIQVSYPPDIPNQHINFTENEASRTLQCLAQRVPAEYKYGQWKHLSNFGEHIRYLNSTDDGRVILPEINRNNRYQDSGIYICPASNGVVASTGNTFQKGKIFVIANGPPIFLDTIENKQYGDPRNIFSLAFVAYTKSEIEHYTVKRENNQDVPASIQMTSLNSTLIFHGTEIAVEAIEVVLSFKLSSYDNSHMYIVTLCNVHGNNSFVVEIKPIKVEEIVSHDTKVVIVIILVISGMCVPVSVAAVFLIRKRSKKREIRRIIDDIPGAVEGQPVPVENIVYQDAIAFPPISLQANGEVIEYNYETYSHEQNMRPLSRQLNYSDVYFQPSTSQDVRIRGIENKTVYSEVLNSERGSSVIDSHSVTSSDEEDFVDIEGLDNFIDRSED